MLVILFMCLFFKLTFAVEVDLQVTHDSEADAPTTFSFKSSVENFDDYSVASISLYRQVSSSGKYRTAPREMIAYITALTPESPKVVPGFATRVTVSGKINFESNPEAYLEVIFSDLSIADLGLYTTEVAVVDEDGEVTFHYAEARVVGSGGRPSRIIAEVVTSPRPLPGQTTIVVEKTTVAKQETTLAVDETTVASDVTIAVVDETTVAPDETTVVVDETTVAPDETTAAVDETTVAPDETTVVVDETTVAPDETTVVVDETTVAPDETTAAVDETTVAPGETTVAVDETTVAPDETTAVVDETTVTVDETTAAPDETTAVVDETTESPVAAVEETTTVSEETTITVEETTATREETTSVAEEVTTAQGTTEAVANETDAEALVASVEALGDRLDTFNDSVVELERKVAALVAKTEAEAVTKATPVSSVPDDVVSTYFVYENASYIFIKASQDTDISVAQAACENKRFYLTEINSEGELHAIANEISPHIVEEAVVRVAGQKEVDTDVWLYQGSHEQVDFFAWGPGEPVQSTDRECVVLRKTIDGFVMVALPCSGRNDNFYILCEHND